MCAVCVGMGVGVNVDALLTRACFFFVLFLFIDLRVDIEVFISGGNSQLSVACPMACRVYDLSCAVQEGEAKLAVFDGFAEAAAQGHGHIEGC